MINLLVLSIGLGLVNSDELPSALRVSTATPVPVQQGVGHRFACADYSQGRLFIISAAGQIEWEYASPSCNDLWVLPSGNLLFDTGHGVKEITRKKAVVFSYESKSEIYACQRLPNGDTFIGECNAGRLLEVAPNGTIVKEIRLLPAGANGGHLYMRNARCLENGHYLVAHYAEQKVKEYDAAGRLVVTFAAPGGPHTAVRLPNGNTLIACGDLRKESPKLIELDPHGQVVWSVGAEELAGISLKFAGGFHRLPNGNTVFANWLGHGQFGQGPHLVEVTRDKRVVWAFADHQHLRTVASVQCLDVPGGSNSPVLH